MLKKLKKKGLVLLATIFVMIFVMSISTATLNLLMTGEIRGTHEKAKAKQAFYLAEAGINKATYLVQASLEAYFLATESPTICLDYLENLNAFTIINNSPLGNGTITVQIEDVANVSRYDQKDITLTAVADVAGTEKSISTISTFGFAHSPVFDHTYFINNYGWITGGYQQFFGDIRANGSFKVTGTQKIDGDIYATEDIDSSQAKFLHDDINVYYTNAPDRSRPGDPPGPGEAEYPGGYDGFADNEDAFGNERDPDEPQLHPWEEEQEMPFLGNLDYYKELASIEGGSLTIGSTPYITGVTEGTLTLIGTPGAPISINGPVVVTEDVIISGEVSGQGTIYTGRNIHIIGDLIYSDPPNWPKPDSNPETTSAININKDFLGLSAKGNVVLGDYSVSTWNNVRNFIRPKFTSPYEVDTSDAAIGYISYYDGDGTPYFDGDYTADDGGQKEDGSSRKYYESSLSDTNWEKLNPSNDTSQIDALIYTNHLVGGMVGEVTFNGSVIGRDDGIVFSNALTMNFDYRTLTQGKEFIDINLPINLMNPQLKTWILNY